MINPPTIARLRDGTPVGAWLFKANPEVWDVLTFLRSGADVDSWRMAPSYRVDLVHAGHPAVLWVTGPSNAPYIPGVWATGEVLGDAFEDIGDPDDLLWRDHAAQRQVRPYVELRLGVLAEPVARATLRDDPRFADAEIIRRPRMGSPVALRPGEWGAILDRLRGNRGTRGSPR